MDGHDPTTVHDVFATAQLSPRPTPSLDVTIPAEPPAKKIRILEDVPPSSVPTVPAQNPVPVESSEIQDLIRREHEVQDGQAIVTYVKLREFP